MTISTNTVTAGPFNGNGATDQFGFNFKVFDPAHLKAYIREPNGTTHALTNGVDFTVTLNANQDTNPGGYITFPVPSSSWYAQWQFLPSGWQLSITHCPPQLQLTDLEDGTTFRAQTIEEMADYLTVLVQCLKKKLDCTIGFDEATCSFNGTVSLDLPSPVPGAHLCWDAAGQRIVNCTGAPGSIPAVPGANGDIVVWNNGGLDTLGSTIVHGTDGNLTAFDPAGGGDIVDSGVSATDVVTVPPGTGAAKPTNQVAEFDGSGNIVGSGYIINNGGHYNLGSVALGSSPPIAPFSGQLWVNDATAELYVRNSANTAWVLVGNIDQFQGHNGGFDADTLDGLHASDFYRYFVLTGAVNLDTLIAPGKYAIQSTGAYPGSLNTFQLSVTEVSNVIIQVLNNSIQQFSRRSTNGGATWSAWSTQSGDCGTIRLNNFSKNITYTNNYGKCIWVGASVDMSPPDNSTIEIFINGIRLHYSTYITNCGIVICPILNTYRVNITRPISSIVLREDTIQVR